MRFVIATEYKQLQIVGGNIYNEFVTIISMSIIIDVYRYVILYIQFFAKVILHANFMYIFFTDFNK